MSPAKRYIVAPQGGGPPLLITSNSPLVSGEVGLAYSQTLQGTGGAPPYFWSTISGFFPTGLSLSVGGVVSGTPTATGSSTVVLQIMDSRGTRSPVKSFGITIVAAVGITTSTPLPAATQGSAYTQVIAASGGVTPYTWSIASQTGTNTWAIGPSSGNLTGTPANAETDSITVEVVDALGGISTRVFSLTVNTSTVAATPTFSPAAGTYTSTQTVTISDTTPSSTIYYTTNGSTPTTSSTVYTSPITVSVTTTVKAIATAAGFLQSAVGSATYTISASGTNYEGVNVSSVQSATTEMPFLNTAKITGTTNFGTTGWYASGSTTQAQLVAVLDSNGYATSLPGGNLITSYTNSQMNNQDPLGANGSGLGNGPPPGAASLYPTGTWSFQFQGACTVVFATGATALATSSPNVSVSGTTITSTMTSTQTGVVTFTATTPASTGIQFNITALPSSSNYFRNHALVRPGQLANYNAAITANPNAIVIDPNWVSMITNASAGGFKRLRFMQALLSTEDSLTNQQGPLYGFQLPALTTGSSLTQTLTAAWTGGVGTFPCVLGNGSTPDTAQNNTVTVTPGSTTVVFGSAFTQSVTAGNTNLWVQSYSGWSTRNQPGFAFWTAGNGNGTQGIMPYEVCIAMCNATNTDCWLNVPVWANSFTGQQGFWTSLAQLVQSNLNPGLKCYLEIGNEIFIEGDEAYCNMLAHTQLGVTDFVSWLGLQYALMSQAFQAVFGSNFASTIMIGPMTEFSTGNGVSFLEAMMNGPSINGGVYPNSFLSAKPYTYFTHWGMAPYWPDAGLTPADWTTMLNVANPLNDFFTCMYGNVGTAANGSVTYSSIPTTGMVGGTLGVITAIKSAIAGQPWASYPVHCYESGPGFSSDGYTNAAGSYTGPYGGGSYTTLRSAMTALIINAQRDPRMGYALYDPASQLSSNPGFLPAAIIAGVTTMNYFNDCQSSSQFGPWGALENQMQLPSNGGTGTAASYPKYAQMMDWIEGIVPTTFKYFISTTGSDSNNGLTPATAWAFTSFNNSGSANNALMAGQKVGLLPGTYRLSQLTSGHTGSGDYSWSQMNIPAGTSSSSPTYIASCNSSGVYTPRVAIILVDTLTVNGCIGGGGGQAGGGTSSYITIDGLTVNGNNIGGGDVNELMHLIGFWGTYSSTTSSNSASETGIIVQNCELYGIKTTTHNGGANSAAVWFEGCYGCIVQNNYIHDIGSTASADQDHVHAIEEYGCHSNQYIYNTIANCSSGIEAKLANTGTIAAYNYFFNVAVGQGGAASVFEGFDGGSGNPNTGPSPVTYLLHHNVIDGCSPIHEADINTSFIAQALNSYNNTVYDTSTGATGGWQFYATANVLNFYNNIYFSTASTGGGGGKNGKLVVGTGGYTTLDYNCWYQSAGNYNDMWGINTTAYNTFASWQSATSAEAHSISGSNPTFSTTITSGNGPNQFQLGSGSPCNGTGQSGDNMGAWDGTAVNGVIGANWVAAAGVYPITADSSG
jgi:Chitobiase/beta-hexosaminidase C-terminal domain